LLLALAEVKTNFWLLGQAKAEIYQGYHPDGPVNNNAKCQQKWRGEDNKGGAGSGKLGGRRRGKPDEEARAKRADNNGQNGSTHTGENGDYQT